VPPIPPDRAAGVVVLEVVVDSKGNVSSARVLTSLGYGLDEKASEAAKKWKFDAAGQDGQAVDASMKVDLAFRSM
jgi:periplasmic protein TonB